MKILSNKAILLVMLLLSVIFFISELNTFSKPDVPIFRVKEFPSQINLDVGGSHQFSMVIANDGDEGLVISDIQPSCGCITLNSGELTIPPQGSASILVKVRDIRGVGSTVYAMAFLLHNFSFQQQNAKTL